MITEIYNLLNTNITYLDMIYGIIGYIIINLIYLFIQGFVIGWKKGKPPKFIVDEFDITHKNHDLSKWDNTCNGCVEAYQKKLKKNLK